MAMLKKTFTKRYLGIFTVLLMVLINVVILSGAGLTLNSGTVQASSYSFNTAAAVTYAENWWNQRNTTQYHDYGSVDCANFVSQCLIAGGLNLRESPYVDSWGCIPSCDNLHSYLVNYVGVRYETRAKTEPPPAWFKPGDIAMFGNSQDPWQHSVFAVAIDNITGETLVDAHSNDRHLVNIPFYLANSTTWNLGNYYNVTEAANLIPTSIILSCATALKGKPVYVEAIISTGDGPISGATIKFLTQQSVKNVLSWVNIGSATSNSNGKAMVTIPAKSITMNQQKIKAIFVGDDKYGDSAGTALITRQ